MKNYNEEGDEEFFLEVDFQYLEKLHELCNDLSFLAEKIKIEKVEKLVAISHYATDYTHKKYVINIRHLKQVLNHGLVLKKSIEWLNLIKMLR